MLRILCFGDSITLGEKDNLKGGWVDRLKTDYFNQYQNELKQDVCVYNLGIGGETTDGLARRFETEFLARHIKGQNTLVILAYGSNDIVIHKQKNRVPLSYYIQHLQRSVEFAKQHKAQVLLLNLLPLSVKIDGNVDEYGQLRFSKDINFYNTALARFSVKAHTAHLDIYSSFKQCNINDVLLAKDGLHPNTEGHALIQQLVEKQITNQLG